MCDVRCTAIALGVGCSKTSVGESVIPVALRKRDESSVAARESKPASMSGVSVHTDAEAPASSCTARITIVLICSKACLLFTQHFDASHFKEGLNGDFTATASVDIEKDAGTASAAAMRTSSAALGGFSLGATAVLEADLSFIDDEFSFLWNLTLKMEMFVNTSQFYLHMRGEYNKPCQHAGVDALGVMHVNVPGAIEIENAIITGTLYCEGQDPRVEAYMGVDSLVLADILVIEQVRVNLRSITPAGAGAGLDSLDWKLNVSGIISFDKMLEKMPSLSSKDTLIQVHAKLSVYGGDVKLDLIIVHFEFDIKYQGSQPANNPMLHVYGGADFIWPW